METFISRDGKKFLNLTKLFSILNTNLTRNINIYEISRKLLLVLSSFHNFGLCSVYNLFTLVTFVIYSWECDTLVNLLFNCVKKFHQDLIMHFVNILINKFHLSNNWLIDLYFAALKMASLTDISIKNCYY